MFIEGAEGGKREVGLKGTVSRGRRKPSSLSKMNYQLCADEDWTPFDQVRPDHAHRAVDTV